MNIYHNLRSCWIVTEGLAGTENQCLGVAESLGIEPRVFRAGLRQPWKTLSPWLSLETAATFTQQFGPPWPDLLLTSGRKAAAASRFIRKRSGGRTFTVHIQDARIGSGFCDLLAVPAHDRVRGDNVVVTIAAPNRITPDALDRARLQFPGFETMRRPRVAVLIGGNSRAYRMTPETMRRLCGQLRGLDAGLMITASRRTGEVNQAILQEALAGTDACIWDGQGDNPYFALLAWADFILVTADSVSMLSEAATTGKPVYMIPLEGGARRISTLHDNLIRYGAVRVFEGRLEPWSYEPLDDAQVIAQAIVSAHSDSP